MKKRINVFIKNNKKIQWVDSGKENNIYYIKE